MFPAGLRRDSLVISDEDQSLLDQRFAAALLAISARRSGVINFDPRASYEARKREENPQSGQC